MHKNPVITLIIGALLGFFLGFVVGQRQGAVPPPQAAAQVTANPHGEGGPIPLGTPVPGGSQPMAQPGVDPKLADEPTMVQQLLARDPGNYAHLVQAGNLLYDMGNFTRAIEFYEKARAVKDDSADVQTDLGNCYREVGQAAKAIELFDKAAELRPDHWQSRYNAAVVRLFDLNDAPGAKQEVEKLRAVKPAPAGMPDLNALEQEINKRMK